MRRRNTYVLLKLLNSVLRTMSKSIEVCSVDMACRNMCARDETARWDCVIPRESLKRIR